MVQDHMPDNVLDALEKVSQHNANVNLENEGESTLSIFMNSYE